VQAGFYITLAAIPASYAIYKFTQSGEQQPWLTRWITKTYNSYAEKWERRNNFHTQAVEQAGADRMLFLNETNQQPKWVDLRYPEYVPLSAIRRG
jgi:hypothetical protein